MTIDDDQIPGMSDRELARALTEGFLLALYRYTKWFEDGRALFKEPGYEQFAAILYFNALRAVGCEWAIDSSPQTLAAFRAWGDDVYYSASGMPGSPAPSGAPAAAPAMPRTVLT